MRSHWQHPPGPPSGFESNRLPFVSLCAWACEMCEPHPLQPIITIFHLNMFPLRQAYTRRLMTEVEFQRIQTYGDFQADSEDLEPDFLVHVAEKAYIDSDSESA